jgi:hypothetical protein
MKQLKPIKENPKVSSRTTYRKKRVELVKSCINLLVDMLTLSKQDLEKIKIPFFKKLHRTLQNRTFEENKV